jgi:hypothetical protein
MKMKSNILPHGGAEVTEKKVYYRTGGRGVRSNYFLFAFSASSAEKFYFSSPCPQCLRDETYNYG